MTISLDPPDRKGALTQWRRSLAWYYVLLGTIGATWTVRLPTIRVDLSASNLDLGLLGLAGSVGALGGVLFSRRIIERFGARLAITSAGVLCPLSYSLSSFTAQYHLARGLWIVAGCNLFSGVGFACADIAINVSASAIERHTATSVLARLHGFYSVGSVIGAGLGTVCAALRLSIFTQLFSVSLVMALMAATRFRYLRAARDDQHHASTKQRWRTWFDAGLLILIVIIFLLTVIEGAAGQWLSLIVNEAKHASTVSAGTCVFSFTVAMMLVRLFASNWLGRLAPMRAVLILSVIGVSGIALLLSTAWVPALALAAFLWGIGVALGFPLCVSTSGRSTRNPSRRVVAAASAGYAAFLCAPPILGIVAQRWGLLTIPVICLACFLVTIVVLALGSRAVVSSTTAPTTTPETVTG